MAPIKLYGTYYSSGTNRSIVVLNEKNVEFELVEVSVLAGDVQKPEYLAKNPFGQVPLLQDGDVQICESRAINRYIADKYVSSGTPNLHGSNLAEQAQVEQWLEIESGTFSVIALTLVKETLYKPGVFKSAPDANVIAEFSPKLAKLLDIYDSHLAKHKFLAGEFVSLADLAHLSYGWLYFNVVGKQEELFHERKHVAQWWKEISGRASWTKVIDVCGKEYASWAESAKSFKSS